MDLFLGDVHLPKLERLDKPRITTGRKFMTIVILVDDTGHSAISSRCMCNRKFWSSFTLLIKRLKFLTIWRPAKQKRNLTYIAAMPLPLCPATLHLLSIFNVIFIQYLENMKKNLVLYEYKILWTQIKSFLVCLFTDTQVWLKSLPTWIIRWFLNYKTNVVQNIHIIILAF